MSANFKFLKTVLICVIFIFSNIVFTQEKAGLLKELLEKGKREYKQNNFDQAIKYLEEASKIDSKNQEVFYFLGCAYDQISNLRTSYWADSDIELLKKAAGHFKKVISINPVYTGERIILDPYSKLTSVWGTIAVYYLINGDKDKAIESFQKGREEGGFHIALLEYNKNVLASCEKDAVVFTNGDNDTFPLWYLQIVEGKRNDVTVVNLGLLNNSWYIKFLKNTNIFSSNKINFGMTDDQIESAEVMPWKTNDINIFIPQNDLNKEGVIKWTMEPTIQGKAIRIQDMMIIKILQKNLMNRPVYFAVTVAGRNKIGLDGYLTLEGLAHKFQTFETERVSPDKVYENCSTVYTYNTINDKSLQNCMDIKTLYGNYRFCLIQAALRYHHQGKNDEALKCIDLMRSTVPESVIPYSNEMLKNQVDDFYNQLKN